jgi:hypothetical protein
MRVLPLLLASLAMLCAAHVRAQDLTADELAKRTLRADAFVWEGARTRLRMILVGKDGKQTERSLEVTSRRNGGLLESLVRFHAPAELAGTAFLTLERPGQSTEQYIYLSGLKRTRRVVGREREGSFMGSDFTYADLQSINEKHAKHARLADEKLGDAETYVLETKLSEGSGASYAKVVTWIRKSDYVALRTRFYDKNGALVKTLYVRKVQTIDGRPVAVEARMQSENGHATELIVDAMERKDDLPDALFTPAALERP